MLACLAQISDLSTGTSTLGRRLTLCLLIAKYRRFSTKFFFIFLQIGNTALIDAKIIRKMAILDLRQLNINALFDDLYLKIKLVNLCGSKRI